VYFRTWVEVYHGLGVQQTAEQHDHEYSHSDDEFPEPNRPHRQRGNDHQK
jgi:hypothetical protein